MLDLSKEPYLVFRNEQLEI